MYDRVICYSSLEEGQGFLNQLEIREYFLERMVIEF